MEYLPALKSSDGKLDAELVKEFEALGCKQAQLAVHKNSSLMAACAKFICNIGIHTDGAVECHCMCRCAGPSVCVCASVC